MPHSEGCAKVHSLTRVVICDNMWAWTQCGSHGGIQDNPANFVVQIRLADFETFPAGARSVCLGALTIAAEGAKADTAKPMQGLGSGVFEIALPFKGEAYRIVYAVQLGDDIWVLHAFQKKARKGNATPKHEIDLIKERLKRLKELLA